jgi:hypothetical protein
MSANFYIKFLDFVGKTANEDVNYTAKFTLLQNSSVPIDVLRILSHDKDEPIRGKVAERADLTPDLIEELMKDDSSWVEMRTRIQ